MVAYWWYGLLLFAKINPKFCSSASDRNILYKLQVVFLLQANTSSRANSNNVTPPVQDEAQTKWTELLQFGITHFYPGRNPVGGLVSQDNSHWAKYSNYSNTLNITQPHLPRPSPSSSGRSTSQASLRKRLTDAVMCNPKCLKFIEWT
jgi:hypothetical protein